MGSYIKNKFVLEKISVILGVIFWIVNFTFVQMCVNMFAKIISAGTSSWFDEALKREVTSDPFIINKTELLMHMLIAILVAIIVFSIASIILFRNIQLKNMLSQFGIYRVLGYNKRELLVIGMIEPELNMLIALPISLFLSVIVWEALKNVEMMNVLLHLMDSDLWLDVLSYILCAVIMSLVTIIHTKIFIDKVEKKGISYMLGKGVV